MITKLTKLNPEKFNYENHEYNWWTAFNFSFTESMETDKIIKVINKYAVGYCDGSKTLAKPRNKSYAVMFNVEGYEFWFQIEDSESIIINDFMNE